MEYFLLFIFKYSVFLSTDSNNFLDFHFFCCVYNSSGYFFRSWQSQNYQVAARDKLEILKPVSKIWMRCYSIFGANWLAVINFIILYHPGKLWSSVQVLNDQFSALGYIKITILLHNSGLHLSWLPKIKFFVLFPPGKLWSSVQVLNDQFAAHG